MAAIVEPNNLGDLLKFEEKMLYSRERGRVPAGHHLPLGTVISMDASNQIVPLAPLADDSTAIAAGILAKDIDAQFIARDDAIVIRRHAIVASDYLHWPTDITPEQQAIAIAHLEQRGILVRQSA